MKPSQYIFSGLVLASALFLGGCISREQADARLARGCAAAAELFIPEGNSIKTIKSKIFQDDPKLGKAYRNVRLVALENDGWTDYEKEYTCIFADQIALFGLSHDAVIYQVNVESQTYGRDGDKILGSFEDHLKLTETVSQAMNKH